MAWDAARARTVLFGGETPGQGWHNDTWEYDGTTWVQRFPATVPTTGNAMAMVYDSARQRCVLVLNRLGLETWEWDGSNWTVRTSASTPQARTGFDIAYDSRRQRTVLFGGLSGGSGELSDTWEWDGTTWQQRASGGALPSQGHKLAFDARRGVTVMFGAASRADTTWEWDGRTWFEYFDLPGPGRFDHALVYDSDRQTIVLHGGYASSRVNDTWEFNGIAWGQTLPTLRPPAIEQHAMAYDAARRRTVRFGGASSVVSGETWEYVAILPATYHAYGHPCGGTAGPLALIEELGQRPYLGGSFTVLITSLPMGPFSLPIGVLGSSRSAWGAMALPLDLTAAGMPGCLLSTSPDLLFPLAAAGSGARWTLVLPNAPGLAGQAFYQQALVTDPGFNALGLVTSNAGEAILGRR